MVIVKLQRINWSSLGSLLDRAVRDLTANDGITVSAVGDENVFGGLKVQGNGCRCAKVLKQYICAWVNHKRG
jgi:hypothetical protein